MLAWYRTIFSTTAPQLSPWGDCFRSLFFSIRCCKYCWEPHTSTQTHSGHNKWKRRKKALRLTVLLDAKGKPSVSDKHISVSSNKTDLRSYNIGKKQNKQTSLVAKYTKFSEIATKKLQTFKHVRNIYVLYQQWKNQIVQTASRFCRRKKKKRPWSRFPVCLSLH